MTAPASRDNIPLSELSDSSGLPLSFISPKRQPRRQEATELCFPKAGPHRRAFLSSAHAQNSRCHGSVPLTAPHLSIRLISAASETLRSAADERVICPCQSGSNMPL